MDSMPVVFEISSDEEGWGETRGGGGGGCGGSDDYDWISELLEEVYEEPDDYDDVVLVSEVVMNPKPKPKSLSAVKERDLDDEDCVILDCDPDKPVLIENNDGGNTDDLLIVGEKGQLACRDYPHPRHLCAKFPFKSTPHESHCHLCHCYVCDSLAPCVHWGNATSSIDHCHATDKDKFWNLQRRNLKQGDRAPLPVPKLPDASVPTAPQHTNKIPPPAVLQPNYPAQNPVSRPTTIRVCSTSSNFGFPNMRNQGGSQPSTYVIPRDKLHQPLPTTCNNILPGDRRHGVGYTGRHTNSHAIFKRAVSAGIALSNKRSVHNSSSTINANQYSRNPSSIAASNNKNLTGSRGFSSRTSTNSRQNTRSRYGNSVPSHHRVSSHRSTRSVFPNPAPSWPPVSSHSNAGNKFGNSVPSPQASSHPNTGGNFEPLPSQPQVSSQPNAASNLENLVPSQPQVTSQPNTGGNIVHPVPYQPLSNEAQNALEPSHPDFSTSWVAPTGQSNQQPLIDDSQILCAELDYDPSFVAEFDTQIPLSANEGSLDFPYDYWVMDNQSVSGALEDSVPPGLNVYSPEPAHLNAGLIFDFYPLGNM